MTDVRPKLARIVRFGAVGLVNTLIGLLVVYALDLGLHVPPALANTLGYVICIALGFMMSRSFVFQNKARVGATGGRYLVVVLTAFVLNQAVLHLALALLGNGAPQHALAQLGGMMAYTGFLFLGCQFWVFRNPPQDGQAARRNP